MPALCPLCGSPGACCGRRAAPASVTPVDLIALEERPSMAKLAVYEVEERPGVVARLRLNEAEAKRLGARPVDPPAPPARKARAPRNKARAAGETKAGA